MNECVFCKIVKNEIPTFKIYEDESVLAFLDINPFSVGHTLLIPKKHYRWIWDMPDQTLSHFHIVAKNIANHLQVVSKDDLVCCVTVGTLVEHAHFHLIPNTRDHYLPKLGSFIESIRLGEDFEKLAITASKYKM